MGWNLGPGLSAVILQATCTAGSVLVGYGRCHMDLLSTALGPGAMVVHAAASSYKVASTALRTRHAVREQQSLYVTIVHAHAALCRQLLWPMSSSSSACLQSELRGCFPIQMTEARQQAACQAVGVLVAKLPVHCCLAIISTPDRFRCIGPCMQCVTVGPCMWHEQGFPNLLVMHCIL